MFEAPPAQPVEKEVAKTRRQQRANFFPGLASNYSVIKTGSSALALASSSAPTAKPIASRFQVGNPDHILIAHAQGKIARPFDRQFPAAGRAFERTVERGQFPPPWQMYPRRRNGFDNPASPKPVLDRITRLRPKFREHGRGIGRRILRIGVASSMSRGPR